MNSRAPGETPTRPLAPKVAGLAAVIRIVRQRAVFNFRDRDPYGTTDHAETGRFSAALLRTTGVTALWMAMAASSDLSRCAVDKGKNFRFVRVRLADNSGWRTFFSGWRHFHWARFATVRRRRRGCLPGRGNNCAGGFDAAKERPGLIEAFFTFLNWLRCL